MQCYCFSLEIETSIECYSYCFSLEIETSMTHNTILDLQEKTYLHHIRSMVNKTAKYCNVRVHYGCMTLSSNTTSEAFIVGFHFRFFPWLLVRRWPDSSAVSSEQFILAGTLRVSAASSSC